MSFHEVRFPTGISFGSSGSVERRTEIVTLASGFESRNTPWARSRRHYDAGLGVRSQVDLEAIMAFFEARLGQLYGFRWKDWLDHKSASGAAAISSLDQPVGSGDGSTTVFSLTKTYSSGGHDYVRAITKPVAGTVRVAVAGVEQTSGVAIDSTTGTLTFDTAPATGAAITAGYEFDVPVRFDTPQIEYNATAFNAGTVPSIPIVEVRI